MDQKIKKPKRKIGKKALVTIIILLVILLGIIGYAYFDYQATSKKILAKQNEAAELEPDTAKVERGDLTNTLDDISGTVRSNQSVYLYWQISGTVAEVNVEVGDKVKKGDVLAVARIAGIMGAKKTSDLIPLCHNLNLTGLEVWFEMEEEACAIKACCKAKTTGRTGVEMEALTGVQVALLTVYDMCKAVDKRMVISDVRLLRKSGGKSGDFHA